MSPQVTPILNGAENGTPRKDAAGVSPAAKLPASPARFFAGRRRTAVVAAVTSQGVTLQGFLGGLGTYLAHLWIGVFIVDAGLPRVLVSVFFAALTACRLIATWFAESALVTLALHGAAAGGCLLAAACVGSEPRLVLLLATAGFVDPVATMGVRLKEQADEDDDDAKDAAVQRAWTAFNVGILASYAGAALYPYLGACGMAAFSGAVAAFGAAGHLVYYLVAATPETGAAAANRSLVRAELVRILSPCNRRAKGDVDHYTLRVVVLTAMALNFVTSSGWQLAALYYETQLKFPPWVATLVMGLSTGLIAFSSKLTPLMAHGR